MRRAEFAIRSLAIAAVLLLAPVACGSDEPRPVPSVAPTTAPPPARPEIGAWHRLIYHERLGTSILINGGRESGPAGDDPLELWSWNGTAWQLLSDDGPHWRNFGGVAYDSDRGVVIVHGGLQGRGQVMDETWEWDGQSWQVFPATGPGGREGAGMAYDRTSRQTTLFGGADERGLHGDTWAWDGTAWRQLSDRGPTARFAGFLEYDQGSGRLVLYGGHAIEGPTALADTWVFDGETWTQAIAASAPGPRVNPAATFHTGLSRLVLVGGASDDATLGDMWAWDGTAGTWTNLPDTSLPPRQASGLAFDLARGRLVLTGGLDRPGTADRYQDVWEFDGTDFARVG
jgi:hypothetical protein